MEMEKSFEGLKARVGAKRDEQVQLSIRKAEAAIEYAVRLSTCFWMLFFFFFKVTGLTETECG